MSDPGYFGVMAALVAYGLFLFWSNRRDERRWKRAKEKATPDGVAAE